MATTGAGSLRPAREPKFLAVPYPTTVPARVATQNPDGASSDEAKEGAPAELTVEADPAAQPDEGAVIPAEEAPTPPEAEEAPDEVEVEVVEVPLDPPAPEPGSSLGDEPVVEAVVDEVVLDTVAPGVGADGAVDEVVLEPVVGWVVVGCGQGLVWSDEGDVGGEPADARGDHAK